jgi:glyceraldehyde 3-phosphate dehydrogenase
MIHSMNARRFKHDSTGAYPGTVEHTEGELIVDGRRIKVLNEPDPANLPWAALGVDIVLESTGKSRPADVGRASRSPATVGRRVARPPT